MISIKFELLADICSNASLTEGPKASQSAVMEYRQTLGNESKNISQYFFCLLSCHVQRYFYVASAELMFHWSWRHQPASTTPSWSDFRNIHRVFSADYQWPYFRILVIVGVNLSWWTLFLLLGALDLPLPSKAVLQNMQIGQHLALAFVRAAPIMISVIGVALWLIPFAWYFLTTKFLVMMILGIVGLFVEGSRIVGAYSLYPHLLFTLRYSHNYFNLYSKIFIIIIAWHFVVWLRSACFFWWSYLSIEYSKKCTSSITILFLGLWFTSCTYISVMISDVDNADAFSQTLDSHILLGGDTMWWLIYYMLWSCLWLLLVAWWDRRVHTRAWPRSARRSTLAADRRRRRRRGGRRGAAVYIEEQTICKF